MKINKFIILILVSFTLIYCNKKKENEFAVPKDIPMPADNVSTPHRVELGKTLFFDPRLSGSNWISCATCHNPVLGWGDGLPKGIGHDFKFLGRHSNSIINTAFNTLQFWDGRVESLEEQAIAPIMSKAEMNQDINDLVKELSALKGYLDLFEKAYPGEGITEKTIAKALAAFERTVISKDSPFDKYMEGNENAISESAKRGFTVFKEKANCVVCHSGFNFSDNGFHNIGIKEEEEDAGRFSHVPIKVMKGAFKTPTLRDISLTSPYMHNGMYNTLEEVIDHYDRKGDDQANLSPNMFGTEPLGLTSQEKTDLVEFLKSLTGKQVKVELPVLPYY
jgi:cytochrome c peroxidase